MSGDDRSHSDVIGRVTQWLETAVVGLNLCPFAAAPWQAGRVHVEVSSAQTSDAGVRDVLQQVALLAEIAEEARSSTLVVVPSVWRDFEEFLDAVALLEELLTATGAHEVIQLAHFHPRYVFESTEHDSVENYTNRSPYPIVHLLRVDEVWRALESFGDGYAIADANIRRLTAIGDRVRCLWSPFMPVEDS